MNITINVQAPELANAINALAQALSGNGLTQFVAPSLTQSGEEVEKPAEKNKPVTLKAKEEKPKADEKVKEDKPAEELQEDSAEETEEDPKPEIKLEVVRAKLAALSQAGKQKQVKELLTKFECKKLTEVPAEKYAELLEEAEAL